MAINLDQDNQDEADVFDSRRVFSNTSQDDFSDDDFSDVGSDLTEISCDEFPSYFDERDGRLYSSNSHAYPLPVDTPEQHRLLVQHNILRELIGANFVGPVRNVLAVDAEQKRALDLGTGTGRWVMEMAEEFPHVKFNGVDIVPISTRYPPRNVIFEMQDVNQPFRWGENTFDLVHVRSMSMAIPDFYSLLAEVGRILKPGGVFVSCEWGRYAVADPLSNADQAINIHGINRFYDAVNAALAANGIGSNVEAIPHWLTTSEQFTAVTSRVVHVPIGPWHSDLRLKTIGKAYRSMLKRFAHSMKPMLSTAGWPDGELDELIRGLVHDTRRVRGIVGVYHTVHARKI